MCKGGRTLVEFCSFRPLLVFNKLAIKHHLNVFQLSSNSATDAIIFVGCACALLLL